MSEENSMPMSSTSAPNNHPGASYPSFDVSSSNCVTSTPSTTSSSNAASTIPSSVISSTASKQSMQFNISNRGQTRRDLYMDNMKEERLKEVVDSINDKKLQKPVRTVKMTEATRMKHCQRNPLSQISMSGNQAKSVTPLMRKTQKMFKERSLMFGSSKPIRR